MLISQALGINEVSSVIFLFPLMLKADLFYLYSFSSDELENVKKMLGTGQED